MKIDYAVGNPPYNKPRAGSASIGSMSTDCLWTEIIDLAKDACESLTFIVPANFLKGSVKKKVWAREIVSGGHLLAHCLLDGEDVFSVCVKILTVATYSKNEIYPAPDLLSLRCPDLKNLAGRIASDPGFKPLSAMALPEFSFDRKAVQADFPDTDCSQLRPTTNLFSKLPGLVCRDESEPSYRVFGRAPKEGRCYRLIPRKYVMHTPATDSYRVAVSRCAGFLTVSPSQAGDLVISPPIVLRPGDLSTETFLEFGCLPDSRQAGRLCGYLKSRFARMLIRCMVLDRHRGFECYRLVPVQDFSDSSDIAWDSDVDSQLYRKYGLTDSEIGIIESSIRSMPE